MAKLDRRNLNKIARKHFKIFYEDLNKNEQFTVKCLVTMTTQEDLDGIHNEI